MLESIEKLNLWIGRAVAWLTLFMVINTLAILIGRDVFGFGRIWLQELTTWLHATVFLLGATYTLQRDEHVRVDVFYSRFNTRQKAWVNIIGTLVLLLPFCGFLLFESWSYVFGPRGSWVSLEASRQAGGLPFPATPLLKTFMLMMPAMLSLQGIIIIIKNALHLKKHT